MSRIAYHSIPHANRWSRRGAQIASLLRGRSPSGVQNSDEGRLEKFLLREFGMGSAKTGQHCKIATSLLAMTLPWTKSIRVEAFGLVMLLFVAANAQAAPLSFHGTQRPVPEALAARMRHHSWRPGCPTPIADLVYLRLSHFGYDGSPHQGELVVHKALASEVLSIFKALFDLRFPIERMKLIDDYQGDDDASMADNNTSAFNCRFVAGKPGVFSKHSSGRAVDINPRTNPMVLDGRVFPAAGAAFVDRKSHTPGLLRARGLPVRAFTRHGWTWGGTWVLMKDYQHFEK